MPQSRKLLFILALCLFLGRFAYAVEDGFGAANKTEGAYFSIHSHPDADIPGLTQQLNVKAADAFLTTPPQGKVESSEGELSAAVDALFLLVSDTLDMHIYSFKGEIKICNDSAELEKIYFNLFGKKKPNAQPFYVSQLNTIYINAEEFKREVLGHEIAHAIINRYFVVSPPVKVQEILSMYVAYQLRRE